MAGSRNRLLIPRQLKRGVQYTFPLTEASGARASALHGPDGPASLTDNNTVTGAAGLANLGSLSSQFVRANAEYLSIADARTNEGLGDLTVTAWVYADALVGTGAFVSKYVNTGNQRSFYFGHNDGDQVHSVYTFDGSTGTTATVTTVMTINNWTFVAYRIKNGARLHQVQWNMTNTAFNRNTTAGVFDGTAAFAIGAWGNPTNHFDGRISHVTFHRRYLTDQELWWMYNAGAGRDLARMV